MVTGGSYNSVKYKIKSQVEWFTENSVQNFINNVMDESGTLIEIAYIFVFLNLLSKFT